MKRLLLLLAAAASPASARFFEVPRLTVAVETADGKVLPQTVAFVSISRREGDRWFSPLKRERCVSCDEIPETIVLLNPNPPALAAAQESFGCAPIAVGERHLKAYRAATIDLPGERIAASSFTVVLAPEQVLKGPARLREEPFDRTLTVLVDPQLDLEVDLERGFSRKFLPEADWACLESAARRGDEVALYGAYDNRFKVFHVDDVADETLARCEAAAAR